MSNILATFFLSVISHAAISATHAIDHSWRNEDLRKGYTAKVDPEHEQVGEILYAVENPYKNEVRLSERIFDKTLTKEISTRYREEFGRTEVEILQERTPYLNSNFSEAESLAFNQRDYQNKQKRFGNFVVKRVAEYHFEHETKNNPDLKTVYETKQKIEKVDVSFSKNYKLRAKYKISSNNIIVELKNPYLNLQSRQELSGKETIYSISKDFPKLVYIVTDFYTVNRRWDIAAVKGLTPTLSCSLSYTPFMDVTVDENGVLREITDRRVMAGLNYSF